MISNDIVIAGAGIAGIATAHELAVKHGVTRVTLLDPRPPLTLTSDKSGANYREWWPRRPMVDLVRRSVEIMRSLHRSGAPFRMNRRGYLYVTSDAERARLLPDTIRPYEAAGIRPIRLHLPDSPDSNYHAGDPDGLGGPDGADVLLSQSLIQQTFPHLSRQVTGAIHTRNAGSVDPVALGRHLLAVAEKRGAKLVRGEVTAIECAGSRVSAVIVSSNGGQTRFETQCLVNAAGPFLQRVQTLAGSTIPIVNVLQQKIWLPDPLDIIPPSAPFTVSLDPMNQLPAGLHIKPESLDGRRGIKLGWAFNQDPEPPAWDPPHAPGFPMLVLRGASRVIPGIESYLQHGPEAVVQTSGFYVKTPDDLPAIGPIGPDGMFVVGGLSGYGAMAACAVAEIAASWIAGSSTRPTLARDFEPRRFEDTAYLARMNTGSETRGAL